MEFKTLGVPYMSRLISEGIYRVHHYEADSNGRVFVASLMNYLEDMAIEQAEELGIGIDYLIENNIAWVVYKWDVKINKFPYIGDKIRVKTWPYSYRKFYAYRQYEVLNSEAEVIISANSLWFMIDLKRRRPCKISENIIKKFGISEDKNKTIDFEKLKVPSRTDIDKSIHVRYGDIDTNKHVNNVKYISWALESIPYDIITNCNLKELKINYEKETTYGESVRMNGEITEEENQYIIISSLLNKEDEKLTLVKTVWEKQ